MLKRNLVALGLLLFSGAALPDYTLKSTGQATELIICLMVDEDGLTLKEFVNGYTSTWNGSNAWTNNDVEMTVDDPVTVGTTTWKSESRDYFRTLADGSFAFDGVRFTTSGAGRPSIPIGSGNPGIGVFFASAGHSASSGTSWGYAMQINADTAGIKRTGTTSGPFAWEIGGGTFAAQGTSPPTDDSTHFSFGANYEYNTSQSPAPDYFYGLESGSLAGDGNYTAEARGASSDTIGTIGGGAGLGHQAGRYLIYAVFDSPRSLAQMQALHDDFFGELFEAPAGGGSNAAVLRRRHN